MPSRREFLSLPAIALAACSRKKGTGFGGYAFVANKEGNGVAAVDLTGFAVAKSFPLGSGPTEVAADPVRPAVYALTPETGTVHQIRTNDLSVGPQAAVGGRSSSMRLTSGGEAIWVLVRDSRKLISLSPGTLRAEASVPLPAEPLDFDISPDGTYAAVVFKDAKTLGLVNLQSRQVQSQMPLEGTPGTVRFRSDGRVAIVSQLEPRQLWLVDVATGKMMVKLPLGVRPDYLCFSADGGQLFVTGDGADAVVIVYPYNTPVVAETVLAGRAPGAMATSANPPYLFVANPLSGEVTILSVVTRKLVAKVNVGTEPGYIAVTPDDQYALVLNRKSGDMAVLRLGAIQPNRSKTAPLFTMIPVGSRPVSLAIRGI
jgi:YVTN family beta-propeller protein